MTQAPVNPSWTPGEALAFEAARECITDLISIRARQIQAEQDTPKPDAARLASLEEQCTRLNQERAALQVGDHAQIARIRSVYGATVRAWKARQSAPDHDLEAQLLDDLLFDEHTAAQRAAMAEIVSRPGAVGYDRQDRLVRLRADGSDEVLTTPIGS